MIINYKEDGFWSWIICLCAFVTNAVVFGVDFSFGEILDPILKDFNSTEADVALIGSLHSSMHCFSASISSIMAQKYGFAPIILIGIMIFSISFAISITSTSITLLTFYYGFLGGFGMGLIYAPGCIICSLYFNKQKALATGIASFGSGIGIAIISQLMNTISRSYGWKGCAILLASICPLCSPLAIMDYFLSSYAKDKNQAVNNNVITSEKTKLIR